ncbi:hypothetical protein F5Y18DRAFT_298843 [Xylariaceae sp. FL1019]|nr:hypothetical protein F5Y18DRAFT_298843 [Xylariaceae sp. FL1019]
MAVTNLVWLTSSSDTFTAENKAAMEDAFDAQADWVARNVPSAPKDREARGVALFQQLEDPRVVMESAHWSSTEEHMQWLASTAYRDSSAPLARHFDFSKLEYFHLDTDVFRPVDEAAGEVSLLKNPVISIARVQGPPDKKDELCKAWEESKRVLESFAKPSVLRSGYRVQKVDPETEEFLFFVGWPDDATHRQFAKQADFERFAAPLGNFAKSHDVKHYKRVI